MENKNEKYGKCRACPEYGLFREDLGDYADDWCYEQYIKYGGVKKNKVIDDNYNRTNNLLN